MLEPRIEAARIDGASPTLVFLHEGLGSLSSWRDFPLSLATATGRAALVYNRAGYGRSPMRKAPWPVEFMHDEARTLAALIRDDEVILVGHSDGGSIALLYAAEHRVRGLVLEAPHVFVEDKTLQSIAALGDDVRERLGRHHDHAAALFDAWRDVWLRPAFRAWNIEECLARVHAPTLVIQGEDDEYGTTAQVDAIRRQLGARCETLLLPECGHAPHRDQPAKTLAAMSAFISTIS
jgi:pimeloyl-ACP methyl ester carboxylesterase